MTVPWRRDAPGGPGVDDLLAALADLARAAHLGIILPDELEGPIRRILGVLHEEGTPPEGAVALLKQSLARGGFHPAPDGDDEASRFVHRAVEWCIAEYFRTGLTSGNEG